MLRYIEYFRPLLFSLSDIFVGGGITKRLFIQSEYVAANSRLGAWRLRLRRQRCRRWDRRCQAAVVADADGTELRQRPKAVLARGRWRSAELANLGFANVRLCGRNRLVGT